MSDPTLSRAAGHTLATRSERGLMDGFVIWSLVVSKL